MIRSGSTIVLYWFSAIVVLAAVVGMRGECAGDVACRRSGNHLTVVMLVFFAVVFSFAVRRLAKHYPKG